MRSALTLLILLVALWLPATARAQSGNQPPAPAAVKLTQAQKEWLLATSAILTELNHERHDLLAGAELTDEKKKTARETLRDWWGTSDRDDLLKTLDWLQKQGHREQFNSIAAKIDSPETKTFQKNYLAIYVDALKQGGPKASGEVLDLKNKLDIVGENYKELGSKSIEAWDFARYVSVCRWGYVAGYLSEDEAWARIYPAGAHLQSVFSSWQDLGRDYLIGRRFWRYDTAHDDATEKAVMKKLSEDPASPWKKIPWHLDLKQP